MEPDLNALLDGIARDLERAQMMVAKRVDAAKKESTEHILETYYDLSTKYGRIDDARKEMNKSIDHMKNTVIPEEFENRDVKTLTLASLGRRFTVNNRLTASMADREKAMKWLRDTGNEALIIETVNSSTLSSFVKDLIENQGTEPPEAIKVNTMRYVSMTKV